MEGNWLKLSPAAGLDLKKAVAKGAKAPARAPQGKPSTDTPSTATSDCRSLYYCGRHVGRELLPRSDGRCGTIERWCAQ